MPQFFSQPLLHFVLGIYLPKRAGLGEGSSILRLGGYVQEGGEGGVRVPTCGLLFKLCKLSFRGPHARESLNFVSAPFISIQEFVLLISRL